MIAFCFFWITIFTQNNGNHMSSIRKSTIFANSEQTNESFAAQSISSERCSHKWNADLHIKCFFRIAVFSIRLECSEIGDMLQTVRTTFTCWDRENICVNFFRYRKNCDRGIERVFVVDKGRCIYVHVANVCVYYVRNNVGRIAPSQIRTHFLYVIPLQFKLLVYIFVSGAVSKEKYKSLQRN